ncbi:MAG: hypothetical protein U5K72_02535 [Balneolaceae bacterium]|nr:hypothetical protein [Balneolaceae bacterium]
MSQQNEKITIPKSEISEISYAPSAMPAVGDRLNKQQIQDLVEFLSQLSGEQGN